MDAQYRVMKSELISEVKDHILPFWMGLADWEHGGFYGAVYHDLTIRLHGQSGRKTNGTL